MKFTAKILFFKIGQVHFCCVLFCFFFKCLIQLLRQEGVELFEKPKIPEPKSTNQTNNRNLNHELELLSKRNFETDKEWLEYCEWLAMLSRKSIENFLRGITIGTELKESWLVCQGAAYIWNYVHHIVESKNNRQIVKILEQAFEALKQVRYQK
jgi:hypothetical protein